jgi:hypothetical protein
MDAWQELAITSTIGQQQQRQRTRELLTESASLNNNTNTTKVALLMNLPCAEIFQNVLRSKTNTATSTEVAQNHWNMYNEFDDYDARLCDYAKHCIGETPFPELLPLLMCRGVDSHDVGHEHNNNNNKKITYESVLEYIFVCILLPPALVIYLILLFRLLATTADSYFSPALESFSFELVSHLECMDLALYMLGSFFFSLMYVELMIKNEYFIIGITTTLCRCDTTSIREW